MTVRRALFGGTFDPPHVGHMVVAEMARDQLDVDVVTFLPAGEPWQKSDLPLTPGNIRAEMVEAAIAGSTSFDLDRRELDRDGPTYTADTVASFGEEPIVLVMGADTAAGIGTWQRADEFIDSVEVAVVPRRGTTRREVEAVVGERLIWLDMPAIEISSTELRHHIGAGRSARYLVPDLVLSVIAAHGLYRGQNGTVPVD